MSNYYTIEEIEEILSGKTNIDSVYTKDETYNKDEVYNVSQIDFLLKLKANKVDVYSKIDMNTLLDLKANKNEIYDKNEIDDILGSYYTKIEIDTILENKADIEDVIAISGQVLTNIEDIEYLQTNKQDKLTAGENIVINDNVISADLNDYLTIVDATNTYETIENVQTLSDIVGGHTGDIESLEANKANTSHTHTKSEVGLSNVDNTSDLTKPISTATQTALNSKADTSHTHTKSEVGLANVDNTSDANKPISNATQTALNSKADKADTLGGYGITDAYTKTEINTKLNNTRTYKILNTPVSTWLNSTTYTKYPYEAVILIENIKESDSVEVIYSIPDAESTNYASGGELYEGYIKIFAKVNTEITIPTLIITKIDL